MNNKYRIIDTHAHIFPDKISEKAVKNIGNYYSLHMSGKGTVDDLLENGKKIGVVKYVVHSSATRAGQVNSINDYVCQEVKKHENFIGFGTLHPDMKKPEVEVQRIIALGIKGIKLHPEFQNFRIDDISAMFLYAAIEGKLPLLIHMGDENSDFSSPQRLVNVLQHFPHLTVIAAHFGGYQMWNDSYKYLIGKNIYMDTSSALEFLEPSEAVNMIRSHGVQRFLFGSDYPMWDHEQELARFLKLDLTEPEKEAILYSNAARLLL
ncbi:MAG TPA: amidohydrolase family protein [Thermoclostridium sp.]|nr:amidohydrolase family protein [Thermoclostridium sp.]